MASANGRVGPLSVDSVDLAVQETVASPFYLGAEGSKMEAGLTGMGPGEWRGECTVNLNKTTSAAAVVAALGFSAVGLVAEGTASGAPIPASPVAPLPQDDGHGHGHGPWHGDGDGHWGGPWNGGPGYWGGPGFVSACVSATGPWGYVSGSICI